MYSKLIEISLGTEELECTSTAKLESSSTAKLESSSTKDDSDNEDFSSSSTELVTCTPIITKKSFSNEVEDDTEEEAKDDTDEEVEDDSDDETWSPKTIGTTSKKGATSSLSSSTKKTIVNRGEPLRHCILGLANPKTCKMIRKKEFGVRKEDVKKQVNGSKE
nr:hypothetical protein [Tanacetum cinerariifolium]